MVMPDEREKELYSIVDSLFKESFDINNWKYIIYSDIEKLLKAKFDFGMLNLVTKQ